MRNSPNKGSDSHGLAEVNIYAIGNEDYQQSGGAQNLPKNARIVQDFYKISDLVREIDKVLNKEDCVKILEIVGHARPDRFNIGPIYHNVNMTIRVPILDKETSRDNVINKNNSYYIASYMNKHIRFCPDAKVILNGCNAGLTLKNPHLSWIAHFSHSLRLNVIAPGGWNKMGSSFLAGTLNIYKGKVGELANEYPYDETLNQYPSLDNVYYEYNWLSSRVCKNVIEIEVKKRDRIDESSSPYPPDSPYRRAEPYPIPIGNPRYGPVQY